MAFSRHKVIFREQGLLLRLKLFQQMPGFPQFAPIQHHLDGEKPEPGRLPLFFVFFGRLQKFLDGNPQFLHQVLGLVGPDAGQSPLDVADGGRRDVFIGQVFDG